MERERLGVKEALGEFLDGERERRQDEEKRGRDAVGTSAARTREEQTHASSDDRCCGDDAEEEHQITWPPTTGALGRLARMFCRPGRDNQVAERVRADRAGRHHRQRDQPRQASTHQRNCTPSASRRFRAAATGFSASMSSFPAPLDERAFDVAKWPSRVLWAFGFAGLGVLRRSTPSFAGRGPPATGGSPRQTPCLPWNVSGKRRQPAATVLACLRRFCAQAICL